MRLAAVNDIPRITDMVERLTEAVRSPFLVDRVTTGATLAALIKSPDGAVWVSDGGFLAAAMLRTPISMATVAMEMGWYAEDGQGLRLLRAFEKWARERGAAVIQLSTGPDGPDLSRLGYRRAEQAWVKQQ